MAVVTVHVAKTTLSKLIERVESGEEIIIARGAAPVVKLVPVTPVPERQFGLYRGVAAVGAEFFEPLPDEELRAWEGE